MATVNEQVTDAVTQSNVKVIGEAPAMAISHIYQAIAHSTGILFENAVQAQQQFNMPSQAATIQGVSMLYTVPTAVEGVAAGKISRSDLAEGLMALLALKPVVKKP